MYARRPHPGTTSQPVTDPETRVEGPLTDLDLPIAAGTRSCTKNPLTYYMSFEQLSPSFRAFTTSLSSESIPRSRKRLLSKHPEWKRAMDKEMATLIEVHGNWLNPHKMRK